MQKTFISASKLYSTITNIKTDCFIFYAKNHNSRFQMNLRIFILCIKINSKNHTLVVTELLNLEGRNEGIYLDFIHIFFYLQNSHYFKDK